MLGDVRLSIQDNAATVFRKTNFSFPPPNQITDVYTNQLGEVVTNYIAGEHEVFLLGDVPGAPGVSNNFIGTIDWLFTSTATEGDIIFDDLFTGVPERWRKARPSLVVWLYVEGEQRESEGERSTDLTRNRLRRRLRSAM